MGGGEGGWVPGNHAHGGWIAAPCPTRGPHPGPRHAAAVTVRRAGGGAGDGERPGGYGRWQPEARNCSPRCAAE